MALLNFIFYVVIFFGISTITQIVYSGVKKSYRFDGSWIGPVVAVVSIVAWMIASSHWMVIVLFAITTGITVSEKEKGFRRKFF